MKMKEKPPVKKSKGIPVMVSQRAHEKMLRDAFEAKPRRTLREQVNIINNIPEGA